MRRIGMAMAAAIVSIKQDNAQRKINHTAPRLQKRIIMKQIKTEKIIACYISLVSLDLYDNFL
jgi:hypothetical protein